MTSFIKYDNLNLIKPYNYKTLMKPLPQFTYNNLSKPPKFRVWVYGMTDPQVGVPQYIGSTKTYLSIAYSCNKTGFRKDLKDWIISRERLGTPVVISVIEDVPQDYNLVLQRKLNAYQVAKEKLPLHLKMFNCEREFKKTFRGVSEKKVITMGKDILQLQSDLNLFRRDFFCVKDELKQTAELALLRVAAAAERIKKLESKLIDTNNHSTV